MTADKWSSGEKVDVNSRCLTLDELSGLVQGTLEETRMTLAQRHIDQCDFCRDAFDGLTGTDASALKYTMAQINREIASRSGTRIRERRLRQWAGVAAAALVLIAAGVWLLPGQESALFTAHFTPYRNMIPLVRSEVNRDPLASAMAHYEVGQYTEAAAILKTILAGQPTNTAASFYLAMTCLAGDDPAPSIALLKQVASGEDSDYARPAEWYLALAYLKIGDQAGARSCFEQLAAMENEYAERAKEVLIELE